MALPGRASPDGTARFRDRAVRERALPIEHFRSAPGGLSLSSIGLGTYIGNPDGPTDLAVEQAAGVCLASGRVNVLDTAINYRYQRAEHSLGRALARAVDTGAIRRDEVFVSTKNGYVAPDASAGPPSARWLEEELIAPGVLAPEDLVGGSHAMSRTYLTHQFARSRENLGLATVDLLYLHNAPDAQLPEVGRERFLARLEEAFSLYERFRDEGHLGFYGLATWNCLRVPPGEAGHFSLESAVRLARKVGGEEHGFRFVQLPFSLAMPEAWTAPTQPVHGERLPALVAAARLGLGCFTSVPLAQGRLVRSGLRRAGLTSAQTALQFARSAPGTIGPLVGQKRPEHLSENLEIAARRPWDAVTFNACVGLPGSPPAG
ncbi:MAG TPA: aldo/keto reductase [Thermoplasmata archaeon]|nr:aldo/keto reductase [Thermoplasmata archaeon]